MVEIAQRLHALSQTEARERHIPWEAIVVIDPHRVQRYRIASAATLLGRSKGFLRDAERAGRIPVATRDQSGDRRFSSEDIRAIAAALGLPDPFADSATPLGEIAPS